MQAATSPKVSTVQNNYYNNHNSYNNNGYYGYHWCARVLKQDLARPSLAAAAGPRPPTAASAAPAADAGTCLAWRGCCSICCSLA